jgi:hypothetical protein
MTGFYPRAVGEAESLAGLPACMERSAVAAAVPIVGPATLSCMGPPGALDHVQLADGRQRPTPAGP